MKSILVTGCNRGLGLGLVKHLAGLPKPLDNIFATCRDASKATVRSRPMAIQREQFGKARFIALLM